MGLPDVMIIRLGQANAWNLLGSTINSIGEAVRLGGLELQGQRLRSSKVLVVSPAVLFSDQNRPFEIKVNTTMHKLF